MDALDRRFAGRFSYLLRELGVERAIARRALELLESGEWQEPEGPLRRRNLRVRGPR